MLLHGLEGRIKVRQTRDDHGRFTAECCLGSKEKATVYWLPGAASLLVVSFCLLKSTLAQDQAHSQLPCQAEELPQLNACLGLFHRGVITSFIVKGGKLKGHKGNVPLFTPACA